MIELTESTIMHNTEVNLERFRELKALGVRLAIDDFGMGYSSLSYLHRFPIDILKIDRSFVGRLTEQDDGPELARAVVMLGETLGLETVAEGVEHEEQVAKLLELGCVAGPGLPVRPLGAAQGRGGDAIRGAPGGTAQRADTRRPPDGDRPLQRREHREDALGRLRGLSPLRRLGVKALGAKGDRPLRLPGDLAADHRHHRLRARDLRLRHLSSSRPNTR